MWLILWRWRKWTRITVRAVVFLATTEFPVSVVVSVIKFDLKVVEMR